MKLKQLYNEIKLIPPNRILLQKSDSKFFGHNYYVFKIDTTTYCNVNKDHLRNGKIRWRNPSKRLLSFLDKKHIHT